MLQTECDLRSAEQLIKQNAREVRLMVTVAA